MLSVVDDDDDDDDDFWERRQSRDCDDNLHHPRQTANAPELEKKGGRGYGVYDDVAGNLIEFE